MRSPGEKLKLEPGDTLVLIGSEEEEERAEELKGRIQGSRRILNRVWVTETESRKCFEKEEVINCVKCCWKTG